MNQPNPKVDDYLDNGCGRCPLGGTPQCKVHQWTDELVRLRAILLECGLAEERKWGAPCYTWENNNVAMLGALKESCTLGFFKGSLLDDPAGILEKPGENSRAMRVIRFRDVREIEARKSALKRVIGAAIEAEKAGLKVDLEKDGALPIPEELQEQFDQDPAFKAAFDALTPGRQRGYLLHFVAPKQSKTRASRIEKCMPQIFEGIGLHDHYKQRAR
ncbi:MAG: YdeI/OmpD-associated family protein [Candidatus Hydrogenedentes bacterium]|nr:YdeI/OmpD-associated family protein [Candidatus Hydrogenedentota bacterium]